MPFGIIARASPWMRQVVEFGIGPRKGVLLRANLGRATVTNGDFTAYVCDSVSTVGAAVWGGACGWAVLHGVHIVQGEGEILGIFPIFTMRNAIGSPTVKCFRFVYKNLTTFPFGKRIAGKLYSWAFWRYIRFQDQRRDL